MLTGGDRLALDRLWLVARAVLLTCGLGVVCVAVKSLKGVICK